MFPLFMTSLTPFGGYYPQYLPTYNYGFGNPYMGYLPLVTPKPVDYYNQYFRSVPSMPQTQNSLSEMIQSFINNIKKQVNIGFKPSDYNNNIEPQGAISGYYNENALPSIRNSSLMKNVPAQRKAQILDAVERASKKYNIDPKLLIALMYVESKFNPNAISPAGAKGLMQFTDAAAKDYGVKNPFDIEQSIFGAAKYLNKLSKRYNGRRDLMVAAYNAGPKNVGNCVPDIRETKNHVIRVNQAYRQLA